MARRRLSDRYKRQVKDESRLRFNPQKREIRAAERDVRQAFRQDVRAAKSTSKGSKRAARSAAPMAQRALSDALATVDKGPTPGVSAALGSLGPAATRDAEGTRRRLAETLASTQTELAQRIVDAEAGEAAAVRQARASKRSELKGLARKLGGVKADAGAFRSGRLGELVEDERGRRVTRRGQNVTRRNAQDRIAAEGRRQRRSLEQQERDSKRSAGIDPDTGKPIKGGKLDPKSKRPKATPQQVTGAESAVALARAQAKKLRAAGRSRSEIAQLLITGRESSSVEDTDPKSETFGQKLKVPGVKKVDQRWASVALDLEFDGEISRKNRRVLRKRGFRPRSMGPVEKSKGESRRAHNRAVNRSPGSDRAQS